MRFFLPFWNCLSWLVTFFPLMFSAALGNRIGIEVTAMNHSKGVFIHICVWPGAEEIEQLIWSRSYGKVNLIIVALGQAWRESHLTLMNNLKYKGLVIPTVPWMEEKRFSWEKTAEKLDHSHLKKAGKKTGLVQEEVRIKSCCTNKDPLNYLTPEAGSTTRWNLVSRCELCFLVCLCFFARTPPSLAVAVMYVPLPAVRRGAAMLNEAPAFLVLFTGDGLGQHGGQLAACR